jgi:hypothetical protein
MSWFSIDDPNKPTTHTNTSIMDQLAQARLAAQKQYAQQGIAGLGVPNYGGTLTRNQYGGVTAISTASGPVNINPTVPANQISRYVFHVELPVEASEGDRITLKYVDGMWTEERSVYSEINPKKDNNSGVFSLDELSHARELIDELSR